MRSGAIAEHFCDPKNYEYAVLLCAPLRRAELISALKTYAG
jgi:hypothetical protein